jgi:deoxyribodipyrimidine photolyase-related protein
MALPNFGDFQDALTYRAWRLFHSLLSFALNTKMLNPREVVARAAEAHESGRVPLAAVEGFIRQILGWREYVRGVYWANMPGYEAQNCFDHLRPLPAWFWTGETKMRCLAHAIAQSLEHAYAHHIQRLMVIGNFALLAGLNPAAVHRWYLGIYIDAFEWVELPNTLGMSQFADGGKLGHQALRLKRRLHRPHERLLQRLPIRQEGACRRAGLSVQCHVLGFLYPQRPTSLV